MKKLKATALITVLVVLTAMLMSCNIADDEVAGVLSEAISAAESAGYSAAFSFTHSVLELYPGKQYQKYHEEAYSTDRSLYLYSDDPEENRALGAARTNWDDEDSTEWLATVYNYNINCTGGEYSGTATVTRPAERNSMGEALGEPATEDYSDIGYLRYLYNRVLDTGSAELNITYQGVIRPGKRIIRVNIESILLLDGTNAEMNADGSWVSADGTVVKDAGAEDYNWTAGAGIDKVVIERVDFTIRDGKVTGIEVYNEHISYRDADQRDYLRGGRIYTTQKAMITETEQATISLT